MKPILTLLTLAALALNAFGAGSEAILKQKAKDLANPNNAPTGMGRPAPPATAPAPAAPAGPTLTPALVRFQSDLGTLQAGSVASAEQQQKLVQELRNGALSAKPSAAASTKLVKDVTEAFAEKPLSAENRARFAQELDAILNPGKYPQAKMDAILAHVPTLFLSSGVSRAKASAIEADVRTISAEIQHGGG